MSEYNKQRYEANKPEWLARIRAREKRLMACTPSWVNQSELDRVYQECRTKSATGTLYHVDHIVPIVHPMVCGLHVPWNLQILTQKENDSKGNRFDGGW